MLDFFEAELQDQPQTDGVPMQASTRKFTTLFTGSVFFKSRQWGVRLCIVFDPLDIEDAQLGWYGVRFSDTTRAREVTFSK